MGDVKKEASGVALNLARFALALAVTVLGAVVCRDIYTWFAVPLGAPVLSLAHVYGLLALKAMVFYRPRAKADEYSITETILGYLLVWGMAAIAAGWMA